MFLSQVLSYWAQITFRVPKNKNEILEQYLWCNSLIMEQEFVFYQEWYEAGIFLIEHIFSKERSIFLTSEELGQKFGIAIRFLDYYRLLCLIPSTWKRQLRSNDNALPVPPLPSILVNMGKISRYVYDYSVSLKAPEFQVSMIQWNQQLGMDISVKQWSGICKRINSVTLATKLRLFQYKINQRCLVTNINLFYYKILDSKQCYYCKQVNETIFHLLYECPVVFNFWRNII